jgi:hypothetical protein
MAGYRYYQIVRYFADPQKRKRIVNTRCTRAEAEQHCNDPENSSQTCTSEAGKRRTREHGHWFDGFRGVE